MNFFELYLLGAFVALIWFCFRIETVKQQCFERFGSDAPRIPVIIFLSALFEFLISWFAIATMIILYWRSGVIGIYIQSVNFYFLPTFCYHNCGHCRHLSFRFLNLMVQIHLPIDDDKSQPNNYLTFEK